MRVDAQRDAAFPALEQDKVIWDFRFRIWDFWKDKDRFYLMAENLTDKDRANIDIVEVAKFEAMASIWWDKNGVQKALHDINVLRVDYIDKHAPLAGKRIIDVGCGGGILSEAMAALGADVIGIDAGKAPLAVARRHLKESGLGIDYQQATA